MSGLGRLPELTVVELGELEAAMADRVDELATLDDRHLAAAMTWGSAHALYVAETRERLAVSRSVLTAIREAKMTAKRVSPG